MIIQTEFPGLYTPTTIVCEAMDAWLVNTFIDDTLAWASQQKINF